MSYARDCRNVYAENDKSSRKNIPLRKRLVNRANRHAARQRLGEALGIADAESAERAEERLRSTRPKTWRKEPDMPLGEYLERRRAWSRQAAGGS